MAKVKVKKEDRGDLVSFQELFSSLPVNLQKHIKGKIKDYTPQQKIDAVIRAMKTGKLDGYSPGPRPRPDMEERRRAEAKPKTTSLMAKGGKAKKMAKGGKATTKKMAKGGKAATKKMMYGGRASAKKKK